MTLFNEFKSMLDTAEPTKNIEYGFAYGSAFLRADKFPYSVLSVEGDCKKVVIPKAEDGHIVVGISQNAFIGNMNLKDLILPSSITYIGRCGFADCFNLRAITFPKAITRIERCTFQNCNKLEDIYYEGSLEEWKAIDIVCEEHKVVFGELLPGRPVEEVADEYLQHISGNDALFNATVHFNCKF